MSSWSDPKTVIFVHFGFIPCDTQRSKIRYWNVAETIFVDAADCASNYDRSLKMFDGTAQRCILQTGKDVFQHIDKTTDISIQWGRKHALL